MNISFCTVVLSLIQGIALNTGVLPLAKGGALHSGKASIQTINTRGRPSSIHGYSVEYPLFLAKYFIDIVVCMRYFRYSINFQLMCMVCLLLTSTGLLRSKPTPTSPPNTQRPMAQPHLNIHRDSTLSPTTY
jgi:hypothetical protein